VHIAHRGQVLLANTYRVIEGDDMYASVLMMLSEGVPFSSCDSAEYCTSEKVHTEPLYTAVPNSST
jgi:hypothetical protein